MHLINRYLRIIIISALICIIHNTHSQNRINQDKDKHQIIDASDTSLFIKEQILKWIDSQLIFSDSIIKYYINNHYYRELIVIHTYNVNYSKKYLYINESLWEARGDLLINFMKIDPVSFGNAFMVIDSGFVDNFSAHLSFYQNNLDSIDFYNYLEDINYMPFVFNVLKYDKNIYNNVNYLLNEEKLMKYSINLLKNNIIYSLMYNKE